MSCSSLEPGKDAACGRSARESLIPNRAAPSIPQVWPVCQASTRPLGLIILPGSSDWLPVATGLAHPSYIRGRSHTCSGTEVSLESLVCSGSNCFPSSLYRAVGSRERNPANRQRSHPTHQRLGALQPAKGAWGPSPACLECLGRQPRTCPALASGLNTPHTNGGNSRELGPRERHVHWGVTRPGSLSDHTRHPPS